MFKMHIISKCVSFLCGLYDYWLLPCSNVPFIWVSKINVKSVKHFTVNKSSSSLSAVRCIQMLSHSNDWKFNNKCIYVYVYMCLSDCFAWIHISACTSNNIYVKCNFTLEFVHSYFWPSRSKVLSSTECGVLFLSQVFYELTRILTRTDSGRAKEKKRKSEKKE